ncbi:tail tape measure protein [Sphingomonas sp.]|jgi:phage-related minor tail protein|uniref:tail tape measure protein n=1 Tax=Sphingomonas sp. TaxID=28214 RepID=UPI002EDB24E4
MDEVDKAVIGVRTDTAGFAREVTAMRETLEGSLGAGADRAGRAIETSLLRAVRTGKLGFDDLKRAALSALAEVAAEAVKGGLASLLGGGATAGGGIGGVLAGLIGGQPGRATGGPVTPGRAYRVGERGPELFVPTTSGRVETGASGAAREVRVAITVNASAGEAPAALARSSRQVARAVRAALQDD